MALLERIGRNLRMQDIRKTANQIRQSNEALGSVEYPGLPWPEGKTESQIVEVSKQLRPMLRDNLRVGEWREEEIDELFSEADAIQAEYKRIGKPLRNSGEDTIYHSLRIATHMTFMGITDKTLIKAALWHDVKEDLEEHWERSKDNLSPQVVNLVDAATKVRGVNIEAATEEEKLINDELATVIHLYEAALNDPRTILLKEEDVIDNAPTYDNMPENTQKQKMRRNRKVQRFLWVFYPLLRSTHGHIIANRIAETSLRLQFPEKYAQIQKQIASEQEVFEQITGQDIFEVLGNTASHLENEAYLPNITHLPPDTDTDLRAEKHLSEDNIYFETTDPRFLTPPVIQILSREIVGIYRGEFHPDLRLPTLPYIKIICRSNNEKAYWFNYLTTSNKKSNVKYDKEGRVHVTFPLALKSQTGSELDIEVELSSIEAEIIPIDEHRSTQIDDQNAQAIRALASRRADELTAAYDNARKNEDPRPVISEHFTKGSIYFLTPDSERFIIPEGATYLDAISAIGKNLPISTVAVLVIENGHKRLVGMGDVIKSGQKIEAITLEMLNTNPQLKEELFDMTNGNESLQSEIKEATTGFSPSRFDLVTTDRARRLISNRLITLSEDETTRKASRKRARKIVARMYRLLEDQNRRFDQFISDGFTGTLQERYGNLDELLERLGQISIPLRDEYIDHFEKPALTFKADKDQATIETLEDLGQLTRNLIEFRQKLPTVRINRIPNQHGILKSLGTLLDKYQFDVLPMRASSYDQSDDGVIRANIELVLRKANPEQIEAFLAEARNVYPAAEISIQYPKKKK